MSSRRPFIVIKTGVTQLVNPPNLPILTVAATIWFMDASTDNSSDRAIQGVPAAKVVTAQDAQAYRAAIADALQSRQPIADYGVAHHALGHAPPTGYLTLLPPTGVIDHYVADMTVRVAAGTPLAQLQAALANENQYLPIDGATDDMTIAELITHNVAGPLRLTHGSTRDLLLGLAFIDGAADVITVGGRTVKNVAGYDVTRLMVGSLNTLGLLTEATFKTTAIPQQITTAAIPLIDPTQLDSRLTAMLTSDAAPAYLDLQTILQNGETTHTLHVGYANTPAACDVLFDALVAWLKQSDLQHDAPKRTDASLADDTAARADRRAWRQQLPAVVKLIVRPADTGQLIHQLAKLNPPASTIDALPAHGAIHLGADWSLDQAIAADTAINEILKPFHGMRIWHKRSGDDNAIDPFAPAQPDWPLLAELKNTFDPHNLFNPGRFPYPSINQAANESPA